MDHAITVGDLMPFAWFFGGLFGIAMLLGLIVLAIALLNPFSSGH